MFESESLPEELKSIEARLSALIPAVGGLNRERLIYLAGQQSAAAARGRLWPSLAMGFSALAAVEALCLALVLGGGFGNSPATGMPEQVVRSAKSSAVAPRDPAPAVRTTARMEDDWPDSITRMPGRQANWQVVAAGLADGLPAVRPLGQEASKPEAAPSRAHDRRQVEELLRYDLGLSPGERS